MSIKSDIQNILQNYYMKQSGISQKKSKKKLKEDRKNIKKSHTQKVTEFFGQLSRYKQLELSNKFKNYCGKNFPITYRPQYAFTEQWENNRLIQDSSENNLMEIFGTKYLFYSIFAMTLYVFGVWTISTERYFNTKIVSSSFPVFLLIILINLLEIFFKVFVQYSRTGICPDLPMLFFFFYRNFIIISYSLFMTIFNSDFLLINFIELGIIYLLYHKASETYAYLKILQFGLLYQNYVKIFDLLFNIFIQAHTFAIVLFQASKIDPENSWVGSIGIQNQSAIVKYINSIYFACTTMLTIGYGDISPKSSQQKCVTIVIEIVGVIAFGYMLNQMGHTLSKMREENEVMERDLQTISKISKYYNLQPKLQNKARNFIINNKRKNEQLKLEDENKLLLKLNEDLRQEINMENSLNVVKSSIFYLCHWSKNMQNLIASRLQKKIFSPNQLIISGNGQEKRIYIIKKGKVDITMNRYGSNQEHRKVMKVINTQNKNHLEVSDNIYGYTAVFSNRPVRLQAIAKDFTSTYSVCQSDILFCMHQNSSDFQYYHQIKSRIDQSIFCEEWQAPSIKNVRQHYCPSHILIIKKYRYLLERDTNHRTPGLRNHRKIKNFRLIAQIFVKSRPTGTFPRLEEQTLQFTYQKPANYGTFRDQFADEYSLEETEQYTQETENIQRKITQLSKLRNKFFKKEIIETERKHLLSRQFEIVKQYKNFFKANNLQHVLICLEKDNFLQNRFTNGDEEQAIHTYGSYFNSFREEGTI